jgi:hypothetical protein
MSVVRSWEPCETKPISRLRIADWGLRIERGRMRAGAAGQMRKTNPISATRQDVGRGRPTCEACKTNPISPRRTRRGWRENALRLHYKRENEPNSGVESCGTNPIPRGRGREPQAKHAKRTQFPLGHSGWSSDSQKPLVRSRRPVVTRKQAMAGVEKRSIRPQTQDGDRIARERLPDAGAFDLDGLRHRRHLGRVRQRVLVGRIL